MVVVGVVEVGMSEVFGEDEERDSSFLKTGWPKSVCGGGAATEQVFSFLCAHVWSTRRFTLHRAEFKVWLHHPRVRKCFRMLNIRYHWLHTYRSLRHMLNFSPTVAKTSTILRPTLRAFRSFFAPPATSTAGTLQR